MTGSLTTHVLDTARGVPAAGLRVTLERDGVRVAEAVTNADGRTDGPVLGPEGFVPGVYVLTFHVKPYLGEGAFLDEVPVRFRMEGGHYHVPLLLSPFGYSTYRGS
jgi:5-hydroxyisourate hydrolase